ncbi:MAG: hypothetical protein IPL75_09255 [Acidobacteria bacterium]|nr:hypothetical protein [Acidobacteriota bacterium]
MSVRGRIVFEKTTATPPKDGSRRLGPPAPTATTRVSLGASPATAAPDATFVLPGVPPNDYRVSVNVPGGRLRYPPG